MAPQKPEPVYVEKYATFSHYGGQWRVEVWDSPSEHVGKIFKVKIEVPQALLHPETGSKVEEL